jgi:hypothetical protein
VKSLRLNSKQKIKVIQAYFDLMNEIQSEWYEIDTAKWDSLTKKDLVVIVNRVRFEFLDLSINLSFEKRRSGLCKYKILKSGASISGASSTSISDCLNCFNLSMKQLEYKILKSI